MQRKYLSTFFFEIFTTQFFYANVYDKLLSGGVYITQELFAGEIIDLLAKEKGLNLRQLSIKADVPYNTVYAIVRRKSKRIEWSTLEKLANALDVSPYRIAGRNQRFELDDEANLFSIQDTDFDTIKQAYSELNELGQHEAAKRVVELTEIPKYQADK